MPDYQSGKIYKLKSSNLELCYIGSTTLELKRRLSNHKANYKAFYQGKISHCASSKLIFEAGGEISIELIENFPSDAKKELEARERFYIENEKCCNKNITGRSLKEYHAQPEIKAKIKEYKKEYYAQPENKARYKEYRTQPEIKAKIKERQKEYDKEYYAQPEIKAKRREYMRKYNLQKKMSLLSQKF
jgi:hypothetical protein